MSVPQSKMQPGVRDVEHNFSFLKEMGNILLSVPLSPLPPGLTSRISLPAEPSGSLGDGTAEHQSWELLCIMLQGEPRGSAASVCFSSLLGHHMHLDMWF